MECSWLLTSLRLKLCIQQRTLYPYGGFGGHESIPHLLNDDAFYNIARFFSNFIFNFESQVWTAHTVLYIFLYASGMQHNFSHIKSSSSRILSTWKWGRKLENKSCYMQKLTKYTQKYKIMYIAPWCIVFFFLHLILTIHEGTAVFFF
jgi:hypothetical protein